MGGPWRALPAAVFVAGWASAAPGQELRVTGGGPEGEIARLEEAREVRVVFSEPMVALGRIPAEVRPPFFRITPAVPGRFRWAGTDTLIFTPRDPLPYATRFAVEVDGTASSLAGRRLPRPHRFSFTTPTVRLLRTNWYRQSRRYDSPLVVLLRFNQPVTREGIEPHLELRYQPHDWVEPVLPPEAGERLPAVDPGALGDFQGKVARARAAASSAAAVPVRPAPEWDQKTFPAAPDLLVWVTDGVPPPEAWIRIGLGPLARGAQGDQTPGQRQEFTLELEPTFFVDGFQCRRGCDPDQYNPLRLRAPIPARVLGRVLAVKDVSDPARPEAVPRRTSPMPAETAEPEAPADDAFDQSREVTLDDAGFSLRPARTYRVTVDRAARASDGQTLGYTWLGEVENWHQSAFTSFGSGHGVWEAAGGGTLPFHARNLRSATRWVAPVRTDELMPTLLRLEERSFKLAPDGPGTLQPLQPRPDRLQSFGLDLRGVLSPAGTGLAWAALQDGPPIPRSRPASDFNWPRATVVQVTNLGLTVKDSPHRTLVFVTRLDNGAPVEGARVAVRDLENRVRWSGTTDAQGIAAATGLALRQPDDWWRLRFIVTAEKDGDVAYLGSDWHEGLEPWNFGVDFDFQLVGPLLRGSVFPDRGVYRLGEEVHFKAILRSDRPEGIALLPPGTAVEIAVRDSQGQDLDKRTLTLGEWSSADWSVRLPANGPLGHYDVSAAVVGYRDPVHGSFLVAAYRRPEFRVDPNLAGESSLAGVVLKGLVGGRYLFGAPMAGQPVRWTFSRALLYSVPAAVAERFPEERWVFLDQDHSSEHRPEEGALQTAEAALDAQGQIALDLSTGRESGVPYQYTLEGEVTDVSRQALAGRASFRVDPAPWYLALKRPGYFSAAARGLDTEIVAVGLDGTPVAGVPVALTLTQVQWHSVRRAEGGGFYTWETERREVGAGQWDVTTADGPVPLHVDVPSGGYFVLQAVARDGEGRSTRTAASFYALGAGYTAWERHDHNRIDLVPEKKTYRPGDTARILVKSPWETATALLTTEREGVRTHRTFTLASTQQTVEVPVTEADIPNLYVSVVLVKGRTGVYTSSDTGDPGKPSFRVGYAELKVEDATRRLQVGVSADREEYRPGQKAHVEVAVTDARGGPAAAEVTLWAVDYGVLSLTDFRTPDVLGSVYVDKDLQVMTTDSRQRIISRRAIVPKGGEEGGGGGLDAGPGTAVRRDFRVLAFWLGSLATDERGRVATDVALPESLTTYRIMAVAGDRQSRFGQGDQELRISKPVLLRAAFPRFLARGDTASFGAVVTSQLGEGGTAIVTMRSLDPSVLEVRGPAKQTRAVSARGTAEARFTVAAKNVGEARVQMSVRLLGEADAFEEVLPVRVMVSPEIVAAYGQARPEAHEELELPAGVVPGFGGLQVDLASTALVGLGEGARYLVTYPYGCAEQRASAALALLLAADLGQAFSLPGVPAASLQATVRATLEELSAHQCDGGGFAFWKGSCTSVSPYLTSYVLHVEQRAQALGYDVSAAALQRGYDYLEAELRRPPPTNEGWWPAHTAWQAFALRVLARGGRNVDSHLNRLWAYLDRMPVFALAYLRDALGARGEAGDRPAELERRIRKAILPEGGTAHVEELSDPHLLWFWNSNVRSTAIALGALVRAGDQILAGPMARWLVSVRQQGRWGNTQENAAALEALVDYYRKFEGEPPDFTAVVRLGRQTLLSETFRERSTEARSRSVPLAELPGRHPERLALSFTREGAGTLHYVARLRYAPDLPSAEPLDRGFQVERTYTAEGAQAASGRFQAGQLVTVTLTFDVPKERRYVAVTDPLPAGLEPVDAWFATTAADLAKGPESDEPPDWSDGWERGGFDRVERHDDRVLLFATRLAEGRHVFAYLARATTAGRFGVAPARVEEMYEPEVFGRTSSTVIEVQP
jgi:alpha-2-macroglobulin